MSYSPLPPWHQKVMETGWLWKRLWKLVEKKLISFIYLLTKFRNFTITKELSTFEISTFTEKYEILWEKFFKHIQIVTIWVCFKMSRINLPNLCKIYLHEFSMKNLFWKEAFICKRICTEEIRFPFHGYSKKDLKIKI